MTPKSPLNLKDAQKTGRLKQFIAERENQPPGDLEKLDRMIESTAKKKKATPAASKREPSGD